MDFGFPPLENTDSAEDEGNRNKLEHALLETLFYNEMLMLNSTDGKLDFSLPPSPLKTANSGLVNHEVRSAKTSALGSIEIPVDSAIDENGLNLSMKKEASNIIPSISPIPLTNIKASISQEFAKTFEEVPLSDHVSHLQPQKRNKINSVVDDVVSNSAIPINGTKHFQKQSNVKLGNGSFDCNMQIPNHTGNYSNENKHSTLPSQPMLSHPGINSFSSLSSNTNKVASKLPNTAPYTPNASTQVSTLPVKSLKTQRFSSISLNSANTQLHWNEKKLGQNTSSSNSNPSQIPLNQTNTLPKKNDELSAAMPPKPLSYDNSSVQPSLSVSGKLAIETPANYQPNSNEPRIYNMRHGPGASMQTSQTNNHLSKPASSQYKSFINTKPSNVPIPYKAHSIANISNPLENPRKYATAPSLNKPINSASVGHQQSTLLPSTYLPINSNPDKSSRNLLQSLPDMTVSALAEESSNYKSTEFRNQNYSLPNNANPSSTTQGTKLTQTATTQMSNQDSLNKSIMDTEKTKVLANQFASLASRLGISLPNDIVAEINAVAKAGVNNGKDSLPTHSKRSDSELPFASKDNLQEMACTSDGDETHRAEVMSCTGGKESTAAQPRAISRPVHYRRKKKPRLEDCERKVAQLQSENQMLKRHLDNVLNKTARFNQERLEAEKKMRDLVFSKSEYKQIDVAEKELKEIIKKFTETYSDYGRHRQEELAFHLAQLEKLAAPTTFTKMSLWTLGQKESFYLKPQLNPIAGILRKELQITPAQGHKIIAQREKIQRLCENMKQCLTLIAKLKALCQHKQKVFNDRMTKCQEILTPFQVGKLLLWIDDNDSVLESVCPGWGSERIRNAKGTKNKDDDSNKGI